MSTVNWFNSDGLYVKFGVNEGTVGHSGEYNTLGPTRLYELAIPVINATTLTTTNTIMDYNTWLPKGGYIESVTIEVITALVGATATLTVGLISNVDNVTSLGTLVNAAAVATLNAAGDRLVLTAGSTAVGNLVGTVLVQDGMFSANWGTAAFTAGALEIRVEVSFPAT
jgi:hypothetical protein